MGIYVARYKESPNYETLPPEKRVLRCLISQRLDPTNKDIALGMTEMVPGSRSDLRGKSSRDLATRPRRCSCR